MELKKTFTSTAAIAPRSRLEICPPVAGRLEELLVDEGDKVKAGQTLATMSSNERATLLDAARLKGADEVAYWEDVYKPIPLIAPMDATVIVATVKPGQGIATTDAVVVLADELIVEAEVDETDIGKVQKGMRAEVVLDAYPDQPVSASVERIYYESTTVSNVTIYQVDLRVDPVPAFFRSGMNAQVTFELADNPAAKVLPLSAVNLTGAQPKVVVIGPDGKSTPREVQTGITTEKWVEITGGLAEGEKVLAQAQTLSLQAEDTGSNPFMPKFGGGKKK
jgi:macrolide-specific efflux system membrane fusion protein